MQKRTLRIEATEHALGHICYVVHRPHGELAVELGLILVQLPHVLPSALQLMAVEFQLVAQ